ncbi:MAG TPA: SpoIIE family protein phosphatase [Smithellaceae bacterium]|jgi:phosphoserine phosphatase RsbU/P|nr:SpoIIE family protein phosphatase [Smithellaceae bacterium]HQM44907.1 SpoIIE family protein phosphatase [Smithellaceae bacterium]
MSNEVTVPRLPLVLIVDDDLVTTVTLEALLRDAGLETLRAGNLAEAETLLHTHPVALVLLDVHLPDGNGLDLCRKLTGASSTPVLFISGDGDVGTKTGGFAAGGVDYITKPLSGAEVLARVRTHLRLSAARESLAALYAERISRLSAAQQSLMPHPEDLPHAAFQVCIRQALQAGGDFYDVIPVGGRIVDYVVADASGHDLGVSLWTASYKTLLAYCVSAVDAPLDTCRSINDSLRRVLPEGAYFTALHARLERTAKRLTLVNAGHPPAILVGGCDGRARLLEQDGDILGIFADAAFGVLDIPVQPGDRLYLYTDGLVEMKSSREDGCARVLDACRRFAGLSLAESVSAIVEEMCDGCEPQDDIVLLGVEV